METESRGMLYIIACAAPPASEIHDLVKLARGAAWEVGVVATPHAMRFIDAATIEQLTGYPVRSEYKEPGQPDSLPKPTAVIVAPATFNTINKWALGIADTLAVSLLCEHLGRGIPIVVAPCLKDELTRHPAFSRHEEVLQHSGVSILFDPRHYQAPKMVPWHILLSELDRMMEQRTAPRRRQAKERPSPFAIARLARTSAEAFWQGFRQHGKDVPHAD